MRKKHGFPGGQCKKKDGSRQISGGRVKVVGIPGGTPKVEEKIWISRGVYAIYHVYINRSSTGGWSTG